MADALPDNVISSLKSKYDVHYDASLLEGSLTDAISDFNPGTVVVRSTKVQAP